MTKTPAQIANEIVDRFSWSSNVMLKGKLVGQQYVVALAIAEAIEAERAAARGRHPIDVDFSLEQMPTVTDAMQESAVKAYQQACVELKLKDFQTPLWGWPLACAIEAALRVRVDKQLERANRILAWMMPYIGTMAPPQNGLGDLNDHCFENGVTPNMSDDTKGPSIRQHSQGARPDGVIR